MSAPTTPADDLLTLLPLPTVLVVRGEEVSLSKLRLRQLPAALVVAAPILAALETVPAEEFTTERIHALLEEGLRYRAVRDSLAQLLEMCTGREARFFRRLKRAELAAAGTALIVFNSAVFQRDAASRATQKKSTGESFTFGLADVVQLLLRNGHRLEQVLDYDFDQLRAFERAALRAERRARADFIEDTAKAVSVLFAEKPGKALKELTQDLRNG